MRTTIDLPDDPDKRHKKVSLPLVPSKRPGSISLSSEKIARILEYEDLVSLILTT
jgi:hypothetical protein